MQKDTNPTQVATKGDIQSLGKNIRELRTESKRTEKSHVKEILRVEERVENLEEGQKRLGVKVDNVEKRLEVKIENVEQRLGIKLDKIMNTLDGFVARVDNLTVENQVGVHQTRELRVQVDGHEKRIKHLESSA